MKLVIHLGLPKAGSTAFQEWCNSSSAILSNYGVCYPGMEPENGAFLAAYLSSPSPIRLEKVLSQLKLFSSEAQSRGLETLLLSSEQIFHFAHSFKELSTQILAYLEIFQTLSVLMICRDPGEVAKSSWKQAILASGEKRSLDKFSTWLIQVLSENTRILAESKEFNLIKYTYATPLNFIEIIKTISFGEEPACSRESIPNALESNQFLINQTLPDRCYQYWLSCNRAYAYRAFQISFIRLMILNGNSILRKRFLESDCQIKCQNILLAIENLALRRFFEQSALELAATLVFKFMNNATIEQQQAAIEFLIINDDYLYEPMFNKSHADEIISMMTESAGRSTRIMDILKANFINQSKIESEDL